MVRHGQAAAAFDNAADPGLDALGQSQAEAVSKVLAPKGPLPILSSPLLRTRETAQPLAKLWKREPVIEHAVAEIPSPGHMSLAERGPWLRQFMAGSWRDADKGLAEWRERAISALAAQKDDVVIFSHYVAINVAMGAAIGDDKVVVFSPANCSVTVFDTDGERLALVERGLEASLTRVN
jgi:broad specificity phosphatase PhoE